MAIKSRVRAYERRRVGPEVLVTGKAQSSAVYGLTNGKPGMPSVTHLFCNPTLTVRPGDFNCQGALHAERGNVLDSKDEAPGYG